MRALFLIWLYRVLTCGAKYMSNRRLSWKGKITDDHFSILFTVSTSMLSSPNGFSSDLHLIQQLETRRVLGLVELEDDVADLRFQL